MGSACTAAVLATVADGGGGQLQAGPPAQGRLRPHQLQADPGQAGAERAAHLRWLFGSMAYGYWQYKRGIKVVRKQEIEMKSAGLALIPLTLAERDREFLKQLRRNRDAEEKLMADVEGWEVGTFYGHK